MSFTAAIRRFLQPKSKPARSLAARRLGVESLEQRALLSAAPTGVSTTMSTGTYVAAKVIPITVTFNEAVNVTGTPQLALNSGSAAVANYVSGSGSSTLTFDYIVGSQDNASDLDYASTSALTLNGGTIEDSTSTAASLTLPATGTDGLAAQNITVATIDGFETGDFSALPWQLSTAGTASNWSVENTSAFDGTYSAQSGAVSGLSNSTLSLTLTMQQAGEVSFFSKVSSATGTGSLIFEVDGLAQQQLSGSTPWQQSFFWVSAGQHTFSWIYGKNAADPSGDDFALLDDVHFVPGTTLVVQGATQAATGASNPDQYNFTAGSAGAYTVGLNGQTQSFTTTEFNTVLFAGAGGTATLTGSSSGGDTALLDSYGDGQLINMTAGYVVAVTGATNINAIGQSSDTSQFTDESTDQFDESLAVTTNAVYYAYADYNSSGAPLAGMYGTGYSNTATGFGTNVGLTNDGAADEAVFFDSPGNDNYYAYANYNGQTLSGMYGSFGNGYTSSATGFATMDGFSSNGGTDTATLVDSPENDTAYTDLAIASLYGNDGSFNEQTSGFSTVNAYGVEGGVNTKGSGTTSYALNYIGSWVGVPSGYSITANPSALNSTNVSAAGFTFAGAETGATYNYSIISSGGGSAVTGSGTVTSATETVSNLNVSSLPDGTLTFSVTLTDTNGTGSPATTTAALSTVAPSGYTITPDNEVINASQATATGFTFAGAEVNSTYNYSITSSGGGSAVTGSGTVTSATEDVMGVNVSTLPDGTLSYSVTLTNANGPGVAATGTATLDTTAPSGYSITPDNATINASQATATGFTFAGAVVDDSYNYSITSSGGGTAVTGSGTVTSATENVTGINVSTLSDGTLSYSVTLTDIVGNVGAAATGTATLDTTAPSGYSITPDNATINASQATATGFTFTGAVVGDTYNYSITSSGGGTAVTGSGTVTSATEDVTGINVSTLGDGTLSYSVTLTDDVGNVGTAATATATLDTAVPSGYSITPDNATINASQATATGFTFAGADVGDTYNYSITSSGGVGSVTGSGTVTSTTEDITGINVSTLSDGTLSYSVTLTNSNGPGTAATATATLDTTAPSGYSITPDNATINASQATATGFTFAGAEVGSTYNYSITSSGGGTAVIGSGTVTSATEDVSGINVSTLNDGTLSYSVTLTDTAGNVGTAATGTATLDTTAPSGYSITPDNSTIDASQATATGFTFAEAEVGSTYNYSITSSGGGTAVTGSGTVTSATEDVTGIDVSTLSDGTLSYSVTLTDTAGNVGTAATATATLDTAVPSGYTITPDNSTINASQSTSTGFTFTAAEVGSTYNYSITSTGGGTAVTGSGTVTSATQDVTGIDVSTLSDGTLSYSVTLTNSNGPGTAATGTATLDTTAPSGYAITPDNSTINASQATATGFTFTGAEVGSTYNYSITSSGGGTAVTGSGTVTSATEEVTGIDVSTLTDGTLSYSVTLTDTAGNVGTAATGTATLDTTAPSGYTITPDNATINASQATATGFTFTGAEVGSTYNYSITSSGGGTAVTGSGTVTSATQDVTGIDVSTLSDGTLSYSVTLTDTAGNVGTAATGTATLDTTAPSGYSITPDNATINASQASSTGFTFTAAEVGSTYNYSITSSGGGTAVTGSGTVTSATEDVTGIDVSTLSDGTLSYSVTLTDTAGNVGAAATGSATLDTTAPSGYTITPDNSTINASQSTSTGFTFTAAEVGSTYNYSITSTGGGTAVTGSGTVTSATEDVTGIDVSTLSDGTLSYSVTLTDTAGNVGAAATGSATLDTTAPSGYSITPDNSTINASQSTSTGFTFTSAEVGSTYNYSITSSGGGTAVTGSGTVTSAGEDITGINVSTLSDGTLTFSVTLTDTAGNIGTAVTATATLDTTAPSGYTITPDSAIYESGNDTAAGFTFANAEVTATYNYSVTSSNGGTPVTGSGTVTSASQDVTGINVSTLADGTLTFSVTLTDTAGNIGSPATGTATLESGI